MQDKAFVDSNIFLYAFSDLDIKKQKIASQIVSKRNFISIQVLNEVSNNLLKKLKFENSEIEQFIENSYSKYNVIDIHKKTLLKACELRENYKFSYYDSLIISSALLEDCHILFSEDMQDGLVIENKLKITNPFKLQNNSRKPTSASR